MKNFLIFLIFALFLLSLNYSSDGCIRCGVPTTGDCWEKMKDQSCRDIDWYDFALTDIFYWGARCGIRSSHDIHFKYNRSADWFCPTTEAMWKAIGCNQWPSGTFYHGEVCKAWFLDGTTQKWRQGVWDPSDRYCIITDGDPPTNGCVDASYIRTGIDSGGLLPKVFENSRDYGVVDTCGGRASGDGKCEAACGASISCDEKNPLDTCGTNRKCTHTCECCLLFESDGGRDYYKKGTTTGIVSIIFNGNTYTNCSTVTDYCIDDIILVEYFLSDGYIYNETYSCRGLGSFGCYDGACVGVSLSFSSSNNCPNEQVTATIRINGFTSSMQGKTAYVLNTSQISDCASLSYCLNTYKVCSCTIDSTGSCSCNFNLPSDPGTYWYTGFVDINGNNEINTGEYSNPVGLSVLPVSVSLSLSKYRAYPNEQITAAVGTSSCMQGKTAYVLNATIDQINSCLQSNSLSYCLNTYGVCTCTISSGGVCSCNFNAPSESGIYSYTVFLDVNGNSRVDSNEYDTKTLEVGETVSLSLSKYRASPNEQITATIRINGFKPSMQGKTASLHNATPGVVVCSCTIDSTGSCSCNFNAPSRPGTYRYTGFVDLNSDGYASPNEVDVKELEVVACYKTCNTNDDCKGDFERSCCQNGLAAYCDADTKTCTCFRSCRSNRECQEGYCCLFSISEYLPRECVPALSIKNYQGKSYLCDPPELINEENSNGKNLIEIIVEKIRSLFQPLSTFISHLK